MAVSKLRTRRPVIDDDEDTDDMAMLTPAPTPSIKDEDPVKDEDLVKVESLVKDEVHVKDEKIKAVNHPGVKNESNTEQDEEMTEAGLEDELSGEEDETKDESDDTEIESSDEEDEVNHDTRWTYLLDTAQKFVRVQIGAELCSNKYLVKKYGKDILKTMHQETIIPEILLISVPELLKKAVTIKLDVKSEQDGDRSFSERAIVLPHTLPMVLTELLRWVQCKRITPMNLPDKSWKDYYLPIDAEDIFVGVCELGQQFNIKGFHDRGIDMVGRLNSRNHDLLHTPIMTFAKAVASRLTTEANVTNLLIMFWAMQDMKLKGEKTIDASTTDPKIVEVYFAELFKIMHKNQKKSINKAASWDHLSFSDYYLNQW